jgi:hypothetical protein
MRRLLALALTALPLLAHAWAADGHRTVATLAAGLLKGSPAEARVQALLGDMPLPVASVWADCVKGISPNQHYGYPSPGKYPECGPLETPARLAEMADYVRRNDRQCHIGPDEDSCHRQTHYADVTLQRSRYLLGFVGTRGDDVVGALRTAILVLQGQPAAGPPHFKSKREALLVLVHLVGDLHQPLHVGSVYLDELGRRVDPDKIGLRPDTFTIGGNSLWLAGAEPDRLKPGHVDAAWLAEARGIQASPGDPADWPAQWGSQSLEQARRAFDGLTFSARQDTHWSVHLPPGYEARMDAIKRQQLTIAGARLAQLLKAVLAP